MNKFLLVLATWMLALAPAARAAGDSNPNLGLQLRAGEHAAPSRSMLPPALEEDEDKEEVSRDVHVDGPAEVHNYDEALADFQRGIEELQPDIKNADNLPFVLTHGQKTARSILMVHGLTDSPYYMRSLAQTFFDQGYNVVGVLLPGHGTKPEDLLHVRLRHWRQEVQYGLAIAEQLGDEVSLAGFSTGGALVLDALTRNYTSSDPRRIGALYLFSPAIKIANANAYQACIPGATLLHPWAPLAAGTDPSQVVEDNPYRYKKMATNAVCQLYKQTFFNQMLRPESLNVISRHHIAVFAVQSQADTTVSAGAVNDFMRDVAALPGQPPSDFISYERDARIGHADVTRPETNPSFGELTTRLRNFLARRESGTAPSHPIRRVEFEQPEGGALDHLRAISDGDRID